VQLCPEIGIVRDLCDFAKHGPRLSRASVQVSTTEEKIKVELDASAFVMGIPTHVIKQKLVVNLKDGREVFADGLSRWSLIFGRGSSSPTDCKNGFCAKFFGFPLRIIVHFFGGRSIMGF
jgi:hypothetical protein